MTSNFETEQDWYEYDSLEDDFYAESLEVIDEFQTIGLMDPIIFGGITLIVGLFLIGFLTRITPYVFGSFFDQRANPLINNNGEGLTQSSSENPSDFKTSTQVGWNGECAISNQYPDKINRWCGLITQYAIKHNLDPDLVAALVWLESGGNELAYSRSGAVGLMQIMPRDGLASSFMCANGPCFRDRPSSEELKDPEFNIAFGTKFLASLIRRNGNLRDALKSYGPMDAGYTYSDTVLNIFNRYKAE